MVNWDEIRVEFPVTVHTAYLNTAAAGPLSRKTADAAQLYYQQMMSEGDARWNEWLAERERIRGLVAEFINAEPDEVAFTTNTSSGMNLIVDVLEGRGEVISCDLEFPVSTIPWMHRRIPVHLVSSRNGELLYDDVSAAMTAKTGVICLSQVQFSNGFRLNPRDLGRTKRGHLLVINASQSAGVFPIDVKRMGIDALCSTGHKWMLSGYGSGFVYISRELLAATRPRAIGWLSVEDPYAMKNDEIHLRRDLAARGELGCPQFAGIFALGASIQQMTAIGKNKIEEHALKLNRLLTSSVGEAGWRVLSPLNDESFRSAETLIEADDPAGVTMFLADRGVVVTEKPEGIRVATDFFNNEQDIQRLVDGLRLYK
ncbi:MAG TPA: aminotransferase class V-fold PLP-dependent enzyme [Pyrinomonadaceae bacterium]|nr:aminotransferase class V-fold PLP-dependent enzyme [Pyrinomonadaceae bacterium]